MARAVRALFARPWRILATGIVVGGTLILVMSVGSVHAVIGRAANLLNQTNNQAAQAQTTLSKPVTDYEGAVIAAVKKASPAVVSIVISKDVSLVENCQGDPFASFPPEFRDLLQQQFPNGLPCSDQQGTQLQEVGGGSGFIISSDGLIATNKHVVDDKSASYTVFTNDGNKYDARVLAYDPSQDLAILKINASNLPTVTLGDSDSVQLGQTAIAIGNALGEFRNTVSVGVVSGLARDITASDQSNLMENIQGVMQTDAAINPGNSGGPLLNLRGEVVGINTAIATGAQNIGFAIPINQAKRDINSVRTSGTIQSPYLGIRYRVVTPALAKQQQLPVSYGALVNKDQDGPGVAPNSPAAAAGVQEGDLIYQINGVQLSGNVQLGELIANLNVGDPVTLNLYRNGKQLTIQANLVQRPQ
jgi:serine protease Do